MGTASIILLVGFVLLLIVLFSPFIYRVESSCQQTHSWRAWFQYGFLASIQLSGAQGNSENKARFLCIPVKLTSAEKRSKKDKKKQDSAQSNKTDLKVLLSFLQNKLPREIWNLIRDLFNRIKPNQLTWQARIGFYEPDYTACLLAISGCLQQICCQYDIEIEPVWDEEHFEHHLQIYGRIIPFYLLVSIVRFIFNRAMLRFIVDVVKNRRKNSSRNATRTLVKGYR